MPAVPAGGKNEHATQGIKVGFLMIPHSWACPMCFFISDGKEVPGADWRELLSHYVMQTGIGKYKYLDCGHYVRHEKADIIANGMKTFIARL